MPEAIETLRANVRDFLLVTDCNPTREDVLAARVARLEAALASERQERLFFQEGLVRVAEKLNNRVAELEARARVKGDG